MLRLSVAPRLEGKRHAHALKAASSFLNCGQLFLLRDKKTRQPRVVRRSCNATLLCLPCGEKRANSNAWKDLGRVAYIRSENPQLRYLWVTAMPGGAEDLLAQVMALKTEFRKLCKRNVAPFNRIRGGVLQIHPRRGKDGRWRAHAHLIIAVDREGPGVDGWFRESVKQVMAKVQLPDALGGKLKWHVDSFFHPKGMEVASLAHLGMTPEWETKRRSKYAAEHRDISVPNRIEAFELLMGVRLRSTWGVFRGISKDEIEKHCVEAVIALGNGSYSTPSPQCGKQRDIKQSPKLHLSKRYRRWLSMKKKGEQVLIQELRERRGKPRAADSPWDRRSLTGMEEA